METVEIRNQKTLFKWNKSLSLALFFLSVFCLNFSLGAALFHDGEDPTTLGVRLETEFWTDVFLKQEEQYSSKIFSTFQEVSGFNVYTREEFIEALKETNLTSFKIENVIVTRFKDVLVISYSFSQTVGNLELLALPSISVWQFIENEKVVKDDSSSSSSSSEKNEKRSKKHKKKKVRGLWKMVSHSSGVLLT